MWLSTRAFLSVYAIIIINSYANVLSPVNGKIYQPCQLAKILVSLGFPQDLKTLGNWVCLAKFGSGFNTKAINGPLPDGTYDYGLFQIKGDSGCSLKKKGLCKVNCKDLLNDDISESAACALKIYKAKGGFSKWNAWTEHCKYKDVTEYVNKCEIQRKGSRWSILASSQQEAVEGHSGKQAVWGEDDHNHEPQ